MWTPLFYTVAVVVVFTLYVQLCLYEARHGGRVVLPRTRAWLDQVVTAVTTRIERGLRYVIRYIITLSWYYSIHAFLMVIMQFIAGIYHVLEAILIHNRDRAREIRRERRGTVTHLEQIAEHKEEMKLTPGEAKKRKDKALKGH